MKTKIVKTTSKIHKHLFLVHGPVFEFSTHTRTRSRKKRVSYTALWYRSKKIIITHACGNRYICIFLFTFFRYIITSVAVSIIVRNNGRRRVSEKLSRDEDEKPFRSSSPTSSTVCFRNTKNNVTDVSLWRTEFRLLSLGVIPIRIIADIPLWINGLYSG